MRDLPEQNDFHGGDSRQHSPILDYAGAIDRSQPNPKATASLICSLLFIPILEVAYFLQNRDLTPLLSLLMWAVSAVFAIVLGIMAVSDSRRLLVGGRRRAIFGIVVGSLSLFLLGGGIAWVSWQDSLRAVSHAVMYSQRRCASNLRQIGQGIMLYANDHHGRYPAKLSELYTDADLSATVFICPASDDTPPAGPTTQHILADFAKPGHYSYIYLGAGMTESTLNDGAILAYENPGNHAGGSMNFLYGDGHVNWCTKQEAAYILSEIKAGFNPPRPAKQSSR
jgi:prepilin-type processing-associated H-X9-DG protein